MEIVRFSWDTTKSYKTSVTLEDLSRILGVPKENVAQKIDEMDDEDICDILERLEGKLPFKVDRNIMNIEEI